MCEDVTKKQRMIKIFKELNLIERGYGVCNVWIYDLWTKKFIVKE